jgi:hypothetical protein
MFLFSILFAIMFLSQVDANVNIVNGFVDEPDNVKFSLVHCHRAQQNQSCSLLPPIKAMDGKPLFCRNRHFLIGGYIDYENEVNRNVQELIGSGKDIRWISLVRLPSGAPETHHAATCGDESTSILFYIVAGQLDAAFGPSTSLSYALDENLRWHKLPSLPGSPMHLFYYCL